MTLAAIQLIPAHQHSVDARRWRKGLALFSRRSKHCCSPMALAAGTEKYLRHSSPEVRCEDLTAREFAQLAGIKIKDDFDATTTAPPLMLNVNNQSTTHTSLSSDSVSRCPRIWDSDFWQQENAPRCPNKQKRNIIRKGRFQICVGHDDDDHNDDDSLFQHLSVSNISSRSAVPTVQVVEWKRKRSCAA
ncbi:hypothetical protein BX666DRAFT_1874608 [Dichotomocladium elegans]|nr:hypothetical protein BX666DRAFT_1874608 [Dichotomocladium elegans]